MPLAFKLEADGDQWHAFYPELPGCHSFGKTKEEALANLENALMIYLEDHEDNWMEKEKLHIAVQNNDLDLAKKYLEEGLDPNTFDEIGKTPLHYAVQKENFEAIDLLFKYKADVNAHDESKIGNTPLSDVAQTCSLNLAKRLIELGADPTIPGWMMLTSLDRAKKRKKTEGVAVYELFQSYKKDKK